MILFQKDDSKFRSLQRALLDLGIESNAIQSTSIIAPAVIIKLFFRGIKPKVYVFRYLNDYPSFIKTVIRLISEVLTIIICRILRVRVWWLCHNVDKETHEHYKILSKVRRYLIKKNSGTIFVTHHSLIPYAERILNVRNVKNITLGYIDGAIYPDLEESESLHFELKNWLQSRKSSKSRVIFVAGSDAGKALHFRRVNDMINELNGADSLHNWYAIVVGVKIEPHENIFNISSKYSVKEEIIIKHVDFYYRVLDDLSVSYTLFEAAHFKKPIITERFGFLSEVIDDYSLGFVYSKGAPDLFLNSLKENNSFQFGTFLEHNNWQVAAQNISNEYYSIK